MSLVERVHEGYAYNRRVRVLCEHLAALIPHGARVLDVGCGDGQLGQFIAGRRPDLQLSGIEVLIRPRTCIPVTQFDGQHIPHCDDSFDAVMFIDVLHHTDDPVGLLREACRVCRGSVLIKDHLLEGWLAGPTLRWMDRVGNARYGVPLPYDYWPRRRWHEVFALLGLRVCDWVEDLGLYPVPADWVFGRSMHFVARLEVSGHAGVRQR